ncbi:MAG: DUF87 domain-containing protein [Rhodospirillaceae bacterium]
MTEITTPLINIVPTIIGRVAAVTGTRVTGILEQPQVRPGGRPVRVGDLVKMETPGAIIFGVVDRLDGRGAEPTVETDLLGQILLAPEAGGSGRFELGVSAYPTLGDPMLSTGTEDAAKVYARPDAANMRVGIIHQDPYLPAYLATDDLLAKHFAVLGSTGSGKSCTVTLLLRNILGANPHAHVLLLDPHNEYRTAFTDLAEVITPANLHLPSWLLNFEELVEVLVSKEGSDRVAQTSILKEAVLQARRAYVQAGQDNGHITVDTPTPFRLSELKHLLNGAMGKLEKAEPTAPYLRLLSRLDSLVNDRRFSFMFSGLMVRDTMAEILSRVLRIPVAGKPITILDLSAVPSEIVDVVVSVMARTIFDFALWSTKVQPVPLLLVCEEAHRYAPRRDDLGFGPTKTAIGRIAKEGRKYGVSVGLVSQRPSEVDTSILSQCGTVIALRMSNEQDQEFVRRILPEGARGLISTLPSLRPREGVVVGVGASVPMRISFDTLAPEHRPRSGSARFSEAWQEDTADLSAVEQTIERWRYQRRS